MKKISFLAVLILVFSLHCNGQMSVIEKRQLSRLYNEGVKQVINKDYNGALSSFNNCLKINESNAQVYMNLGRVQAALGNFDKAIGDLDKAIQVDPGLGEAYFYKGYFLFGNDTSGISEEMLGLAVEKGYDIAEIHYLLGLSFLAKGMDDKALISFNKAIKLADDYALAYHERAGIKKRLGDYNGALYDYKTAVNYMEDFPLAYSNMGSVKIILGDYNGALEDFTKAIKQDSVFAMAYNNRAYANYQMGNMDKVRADLQKAIDLQPGFMEAKLNLASVMAKENDYSGSLQLLDQAINENGGAGILYLNRGLLKELLGNKKGACEDWNKAQELGMKEAGEYLTECN